MNKTLKSSCAILKQEFRVQFITAGLLFAVFAASILCKRYASSYEDELPKSFIAFYAAIFGFALPWQINTRGHIAPEYCRYNLNLPVHTWQLIVLPLLSRFLLIFIFIAFEFVLHGALYGFNGPHVNIGNMIYYAKISVFIYLLLQAFGWSKDSMKNLFLWGGIPLGVFAFMKPQTLTRIFNADLLPVYCLCSVFLLALAVIGVRNLRKGLIFELPGLKSIPAWFEKNGPQEEKAFSDPAQAQFHQEWKRAWYIMPGMTLGAIAINYIIIMKNAICYSFFRYFLTIMVVFFMTALFVPLLGFTFSRKVFSSTYVHNLPINTGSLAAVRLKVFSLSYVLSLGIFLLWILYKLFIDGRLLRGIHANNQELLYSPGVLVWMLAAFLIWAFSMAFTMVAVALQKKSLFTIIIILLIQAYFLFPAQVFPKYLTGLYAYLYGWEAYRAGDVLPGYVEFFAFVNILIAGWLCLAWLRTKSVIIRFSALIASCVLTVLYTIVCFQYLYLMFLPLILLFPYPLFVMTQEISMKRYEVCEKKIRPSWRLMLAVWLILTCFSLYTVWLNKEQKKELDDIVAKCAAASAKNPGSVEKPKEGMEDYLKRNMPFKETLLPGMGKYMEESRAAYEKKYHRKYTRLYYSDITDYLFETTSRLSYHNRHAEALKLTEFLLEFYSKYENTYSLYSPSLLRAVLKNCGESARHLNRMNVFQRKILSLRLNEHKKLLIKSTSLLVQTEIPDIFTTFGKWGYYDICNEPPKKKPLNFKQVFLSPLCFSDGINFTQTALTAINAMNYIQDGNTRYVNRKINNQLLYFQSYQYDSTNSLLKSITAVAMAQYRLANGKEPENLRLLAPNYLKEGELYLIPLSLYRDPIGVYYMPFLKPDSIETVKTYLKKKVLWD